MRETFLGFFEQRGHTRLRRYPTVARWRNDVFFTQASIYDFQPWVTTGVLPPPANPLTISQPCVRFIDLDEVGRERPAFHAVRDARPPRVQPARPRGLLQGTDAWSSATSSSPRSSAPRPPRSPTRRRSGRAGATSGRRSPSGCGACEVATLVFMEYVRGRHGAQADAADRRRHRLRAGADRPGSPRGPRPAYEAVFGRRYEELRRTFPAREAAILIDHARALNFLLTDGVVPSNSKEGYFARLLVRRILRTLAARPGRPDHRRSLPTGSGATSRATSRRSASTATTCATVIEAEVERYHEAARASPGPDPPTRRHARTNGRRDHRRRGPRRAGTTPSASRRRSPSPSSRRRSTIPDDFYAQVAARHEAEARSRADYTVRRPPADRSPASVPATEVRLLPRPVHARLRGARPVDASGPDVVLDRTYFYPTGGGPDHRHRPRSGSVPVVEVDPRVGPTSLHQLDRPAHLAAGERVRGPDRRAAPDAAHAAPHRDAPAQWGAAQRARPARLAGGGAQGTRRGADRHHPLPGPAAGGEPARSSGSSTGSSGRTAR